MALLADTLCCDSPLCPDQIGRNPGLQAIWEDEKQRRREKNQPSQIETPESQGEHIHCGNSLAQETLLTLSLMSKTDVVLTDFRGCWQKSFH